MKHRLKQLPEGLVASYEEICSRQDGHALEILMRVAMWVKWAEFPLETLALLHVVRLPFCQTHEQLNPTLEEEIITETELGNICRHLMIEDTWNSRWEFAHASIAEFFRH